MKSSTAAASLESRPGQIPLPALLYAWLAAGTLDILAAFAHSAVKGGTPMGVLKAVASGLLGRDAFSGGTGAALLGLALHFAIMLVIVALYWQASRKLSVLIERAVVCGVLYGLAVYCVMNLVVLPLSAIAFKPSYAWEPLIIGLCIHMLFVGLPIALIMRWFGVRAT